MKSNLKCLLCKIAVNNVEDLETHFKSHDIKEIERFPCHLCEFKFLKISSLVKHVQIVHTKAASALKFCNEIKVLKAEASLSLINFCVDDLDDNDNFQSSSPAESSNEAEEHKPARKEYKCKIKNCLKVFYHITSLVMHGKCVHSDQRNFTCEICSKTFKTSSNLNVHIKMHNNQRDHQCTLCPLSFFTSSHLKAHVRVHMNETSYKCDIEGCRKAFVHLSSFKKHQNFHQGIKNHQCSVCQRNFSQNCHLREHLRAHTNERNHICQICQKAFRRPDTLRIHMKIHES